MVRYGEISYYIRYTSTIRRGCRLFDEFRGVLLYIGNKNKTLKIKVSSSFNIVLLKFIFKRRDWNSLAASSSLDNLRMAGI